MTQLNRIILLCMTAFLFLTPDIITASAAFSDLTENSSHYDAIMLLHNEGVINGYPAADGTRVFQPTAAVSREHAAVMFASLLDLPTPQSSINYYADISEDYRYATAIQQVTKAGIFNGDASGFNPSDPLTREQMASVLVRAFDLSDNRHPITAYLGNVSSNHKSSVERLFQYNLTNQVDDFRPKEPVTRAQFASFLVRVAYENQPSLTMEEEVLAQVNQLRQAVGESPLQLDTTLNDVALIKSEDMYENDYFSHQSPTYGSPFDMLQQFGVTYRRAGENLAVGYRSATAVVEGWCQSEGHYLNMIGDYTHMGIALSDEGYYWTQLFIKR